MKAGIPGGAMGTFRPAVVSLSPAMTSRLTVLAGWLVFCACLCAQRFPDIQPPKLLSTVRPVYPKTGARGAHSGNGQVARHDQRPRDRRPDRADQRPSLPGTRSNRCGQTVALSSGHELRRSGRRSGHDGRSRLLLTRPAGQLCYLPLTHSAAACGDDISGLSHDLLC